MADLLQGAAILIGSIAALRGVNVWKAQKKWEYLASTADRLRASLNLNYSVLEELNEFQQRELVIDRMRDGDEKEAKRLQLRQERELGLLKVNEAFLATKSVAPEIVTLFSGSVKNAFDEFQKEMGNVIKKAREKREQPNVDYGLGELQRKLNAVEVYILREVYEKK
ncbi:hypothetical protein [Pseudooceanicola nitratireducens]|uniref:hypothetical protein n=1 Tax=Pseudooceanicola nitratireducens TaxID=517719 RepID=UPI003C7994A8